MHSREGAFGSPEAEPTSAEWNVLYDKVEELHRRYQDFRNMAQTAREKNPSVTTTHFSDMLNSIGFLSLFRRETHQDNMKTAALFETATRECLQAEKYFSLLEQYPEFMDKELSKQGPAYPEMWADYQQHPENVKKAGYTSYQEAYIYTAAQALEKAKRDQ